MISAIVQIWSVLGIRRFMNQTGQTVEQVNMRTLLLHAFTFSLYAISVIVNLVFNILAAFQITNDQALDKYYVTMVVLQISSFASQCLLCVIFWQVGTKQPTTAQGEAQESQTVITTSGYEEIRVEAWDPEADLQARIWNTFIRKQESSMNGSDQLFNDSVGPKQTILQSLQTDSDYAGSVESNYYSL